MNRSRLSPQAKSMDPAEQHWISTAGSFDSSFAPPRMTRAAPDRLKTGTKDKSSRARNISRRLRRFALERLCECCARSGRVSLSRCPSQSALHRGVRFPLDLLCFAVKIRDDFDQAAKKIDPGAAD